MPKHLLRILSIFFMFLLLGNTTLGCSVWLAGAGVEEPDMAYVQKGATRQQVEQQVGNSVKTVEMPNGRKVETYEYEMGSKPSTGRAAGYFLLDILTLGIMELFSTPVELAGLKKYQITVDYDQHDQVVLVSKSVEISVGSSSGPTTDFEEEW
jgi:putative hemolysin